MMHPLHQRAIVIDGHSDILNLVVDGRLRLRDHPLVPAPGELPESLLGQSTAMATPYQLSPYTTWFQCLGQYDIPCFQAGGLTAQVMAIFIDDLHLGHALERA